MSDAVQAAAKVRSAIVGFLRDLSNPELAAVLADCRPDLLLTSGTVENAYADAIFALATSEPTQIHHRTQIVPDDLDWVTDALEANR